MIWMTGRQLLNTELDTWIGPYLASGTCVARAYAYNYGSGARNSVPVKKSLTGGSTNFEKCPGCPDPVS